MIHINIGGNMEPTKNKIINDVIHGEIILDEFTQKIINTQEFQRLKGITQNGTSKYAFPGLKNNTRYDHSIGAYHNMCLFIKRFEDLLKPFGIHISEFHKKMAKVSMLLHDIGHGPLSHTIERIVNHSHEKTTIKILTDKGCEIHKVLTEEFSNEEIEFLISFIDFESNSNGKKNNRKPSNVIDVLKLLVQNQIDADRLDYLCRDAFHAGYSSNIELGKILEGFKITIDKDKWILIGDQECQTQYETVLFERSKNYRNIYFHRTSILADYIIQGAINLICQNPAILDSLQKEVKALFIERENISLKDFLELDDEVLENSLLEVKEKQFDELTSYACDIYKNIQDYKKISPKKSIDSICRRLKLIFKDLNLNNFNFLDTKILVDSNISLKTYKSNDTEGIQIDEDGTVVDIEKCSNFINTIPIEVKARFINFERLRLYSGLDKETFEQRYSTKIEKLVQWINNPEKEFELKYLQAPNQELERSKIVKQLQENGFEIVRKYDVLNIDHYFDTRNLDLFFSKKSMRIREINKPECNNAEYEVTYKSPTGEKAKFSTRDEKNDTMEDINIVTAKERLEEKGINMENIMPFPVLKVINKRHVIEISKNDVVVDIALDDVIYENLINSETSCEKGLEAEPKLSGGISDRIILNEIYDIFETCDQLIPDNNPNKYYTGIVYTTPGIIKIKPKDLGNFLIKERKL